MNRRESEPGCEGAVGDPVGEACSGARHRANRVGLPNRLTASSLYRQDLGRHQLSTVGRRLRSLIDGTLGDQLECPIGDTLAGGVNFIGLPVMGLIRRHQSDAKVMMVAVVPGEGMPAESIGVLDAAEPFWKMRLIFQGPEVAFRDGIVIRGVGPAVGFGNAQICQQESGGLGGHGWAAVNMEGQFIWTRAMLGDAVLEQWLEQGGALGIGDVPSNHAVAKDINDHREIEAGPFLRRHQLGDVPRPDLVGPCASSSGF